MEKQINFDTGIDIKTTDISIYITSMLVMLLCIILIRRCVRTLILYLVELFLCIFSNRFL